LATLCVRCAAEFDADDGGDVCPNCKSCSDVDASADNAGVQPADDTTIHSDTNSGMRRRTTDSGRELLDDGEYHRQAPKEFGRYEILAEINRGAMGIVYRAREKTLGRTVALKVLIAGEHASDEQVGRFIREAKAVARLRHPNIVPIHDVGEVDGRHYFTMDYVDGAPLSKLISNGKVDTRQALDIIENVADAVECAHQAGVVHRDVKPSNIMIDSQGRALIMDFGLAKPIDEGTKYTRTGTTIGTPAYMPPEQARGDVDLITARSDVYSLGAVLYELVTGVAPFEGPNVLDILLDVMHDDPVPPRKLNPRIHADIQTIILRAMEKDPDRRYQSAALMRDDIRRYTAGEIIHARPPSMWRHVVRWADRHRVQVVGAAGILSVALVVLGAAYLISDIRRTAEERATRAAIDAKQRADTPDNPVWSRVWEDAKPELGENGKWEERACLIGGREIKPKVADPFHGNVRLTASVGVAEDAQEPTIVCGLVGEQDRDAPIGFYGRVAGGSIRLYALADIEASASARSTQKDLIPLAERSAPQLQKSTEYSVLLERRMMDIRFQVAGGDLDETLVVRNLGFSNWRAKNLLPVLGNAQGIQWRVFRTDKLIAGKMDTFDNADALFFLGEYNGARDNYQIIVDSGRPEERVGLARLRLGMYNEVKHQYDDALRWYRSVGEYAQGSTAALEARLRQPFCLVSQDQAEAAAKSVVDLIGELASKETPPFVIAQSPWVWQLSELADSLVKHKFFSAAAEVLVLARPQPGWARMDEVASACAMGLADEGRAGDLLALADVCQSTKLAPAFAHAVGKLAESDREAALSVYAFSGRRFADSKETFVKSAAGLAKRFMADGDFAGVIRVHRTWSLDEVMDTFRDAVGGAIARKKYSAALAILAYAHTQKPEHEDVLRALSISLAEMLCTEGEFAKVQSVYEAYPDPVLAVGFEEAARGMAGAGDTDGAIALLEYARRNLGGADSRLQRAAADIASAFVASRSVDGALRVRRAVGAYPGRDQVAPVIKAMETLQEANRGADALSLFGYLRARLSEGDALLSEKALVVFESISDDPEARGRGFDALASVEADLATNAEARAKWLMELGDIACLVGGRPNRAEEYYESAIEAAGSHATSAIAAARQAILADAAGRRDEATAQWKTLAQDGDTPPRIAEAARAILGENKADVLTRWQAEHPAEMSGSELQLYLGLRSLRAGQYDASASYFRRAREMVSGRRWPYHVLGRFGS
jgi:tRNA A-37 threonylcarbamoyl transferase component Bud32/tetratricopeptide (TPR) repeat protein